MNTALITGASKGIGKAIATELAILGYDLLLIARSEDLLKELALNLSEKHKIKAGYLALDLTLPDSIERIVQKVDDEQIPLQVLVNNAGYAHWGKFTELDLQAQEKMMFANMNLMVKLCHQLIPFLQKNKRSYLLNVSSSSAYQAVPTLAIYCASKAFVLQFTRSIRYELKGTGTFVSCLSPGPTDTNFMDAAGMTGPEIKKRAAKFNMTSESVAKIAVKGLMNNKAEIIPGFLNLIQAKIVNFVPKVITENIAAGLYK
jgi:short-subunit dehydrogenase